MQANERHFTAEDGLRLFFRDCGDPSSHRTPVLCLAGLTRNSKDFRELARHLSAERRVLCPDYRGRGRSQYDRDWRHYNVRTHLEDVRHLLIVAQVHRAVVVGTSYGGILAMALAAMAPCTLAGAVINDIGPEIDGGGAGAIAAYLADDRSHADWQSAAQHLRRNFPDLPATSDDDWLKIARNSHRLGDDGRVHRDWDAALARAFLHENADAGDLWPLFRALAPIPVLAVRGAKSDILGAQTLKRMADALPHITTVTIDGVGHAPDLTEPQALEAIDALLARVPYSHRR